MKLSTLQENLSKALSIVSRTVSTRTQLPILSNVLLVTDKGRLKLSATNLETSVNVWIGAKIEKEGSISIPAKVLTEFVGSLPPEKVNFEIKENSLNLTCQSFQAEFIGLSASEFPTIPTMDGQTTLSLDLKDLSQAITQVAFAAAQDETRPVLTGVSLITKGKDLVLTATDGYRLSVKRILGSKGVKEAEQLKKGLIIPARTLTEVARIVSEKDRKEKVGLAINPESNQVIFSTNEMEVVSRLLEGEFPEVEKVIPSEKETKITIETESLTRAVRIASIFAREAANIVRFDIKGTRLKISANTAQVGSNVSKIEVKVEGKANKIAFNSRYLLEFLNCLDTEQINLEMTSPLNPGVFTLVGDKSFLHIIMPVRVQE